MSNANKINDVNSLTKFSPLNELDHDKLTELCDSTSVFSIAKGKSVSAEVDKNSIVYLLFGKVERAPNSSDAEIIKANSRRAKHSILSPENRTRVLAASDVSVLCVDAGMLDFLRSVGSDSGFEVEEIDADSSQDWTDALLQSKAIQSLPPTSLQALIRAIEPVTVVKDQVIFNQGDTPDDYYIIAKGSCAVTRLGQGTTPTELAILSAGEAFGEEALVTQSMRNATIRMLNDGVLLRLNKDAFKTLLEQPLINYVTETDAEKMQLEGYQFLDIRNADDFANDGKGKNIPFESIREHLKTLDKKQHYIVLSDDTNLSAVASFILGQHQFNTSVLKTNSKEKSQKIKQEQDADTAEMKAKLSSVKRQLEDTHHQLQAEKSKHIETQTTIKALEKELKQTQDSAKQAIIESSTLKTKSETLLRGRINKLTDELSTEQNASKRLYDLNKELATTTKTLEETLKQGRSQAMQQVHSISSEAKTKDKQHAELTQQLTELQSDIDELQAKNILLLQEKSHLSQQLDNSSEENNEQHTELTSLNERYQQLVTELAHTQADLANATDTDKYNGQLKNTINELQSNLDELTSANKILNEKKQTLTDQLDSAVNASTTQATELSSLQKRYDTLSNEQELLNGNHIHTLSELEQSNHSNNELALKMQALNERLAGETCNAQTLASALDQSKKTLDQQVQTLEKTQHQLDQKTEDYDKLNTELAQNQLSINELNNERLELDSQINNSKQTIDELEKSRLEIRNSHSQLELRTDTLTSEKEALVHKITAEQVRISDLEDNLSTLNSEHINLQENNQDLTEKLNTALENSEYLEGALSTLQSSHDQLIDLKNSIISEKNELENKLNNQIIKSSDLEHKLEQLHLVHDKLEAHKNTLVETKNDLTKKLSSAEENIAELETSLAQLQHSHQELLDHKNSLVIDMDDASRLIKKQEEQLADLTTNLENTTKRAEDAEQQLSSAQQDIVELEEDLTHTQGIRKSAEQEVAQLRQIRADLEGDIKQKKDAHKILTEQHKTLGQEFESLTQNFHNKMKLFSQAKKQYDQKIAQLTATIKTERKNAADADIKAKEALALEHQNISELQQTIASLQQDKKRRGIKIIALTSIIVLAIIGVGLAQYLEIPLQEKLSALLHYPASLLGSNSETIEP